MSVAGWLVLLVVAGGVFAACAVLLFAVGLVGAYRRVTGGPLVVVGRGLFVVMLLASVTAGVAGVWAVVASST